ncbi:hypothetical protein FWK35_00018003 [Aphis craccivora]|uniref:Uncharacterized protein n=1 Tax=Aphis craccivora TaxID=307492 RepID=A0A6G0ZL00_APHCR|nr:hypothetical protein FWK35_00018003 [Aphis craccivora]
MRTKFFLHEGLEKLVACYSNVLPSFTNLSIINIERYLANFIDLEEILNTFASVDRKLCLTI